MWLFALFGDQNEKKWIAVFLLLGVFKLNYGENNSRWKVSHIKNFGSSLNSSKSSRKLDCVFSFQFHFLLFWWVLMLLWVYFLNMEGQILNRSNNSMSLCAKIYWNLEVSDLIHDSGISINPEMSCYQASSSKFYIQYSEVFFRV